MVFGLGKKKKPKKEIPVYSGECSKKSEQPDDLITTLQSFMINYLEIEYRLNEKFEYYPIFEIKDKEIKKMAFRPNNSCSEKNLKIDRKVIMPRFCKSMGAEFFASYVHEAIKNNSRYRLYNQKPEMNFYELNKPVKITDLILRLEEFAHPKPLKVEEREEKGESIDKKLDAAFAEFMEGEGDNSEKPFL